MGLYRIDKISPDPSLPKRGKKRNFLNLGEKND
jgi:hypothetical protein